MDVLTKKNYKKYDYLSRYSNVPFYYHTLDDKYVYGIGSNMKKDCSYIEHKITETDNLDYLALKYYNNPTYWWVIAYFNDIPDVYITLIDEYKTLKIPNILSVSFGDER